MENQISSILIELKQISTKLVYNIDFKDTLILYTLKLTNLQDAFTACSPDENDLNMFNQILIDIKLAIEDQSWITLCDTTYNDIVALMEKFV